MWRVSLPFACMLLLVRNNFWDCKKCRKPQAVAYSKPKPGAYVKKPRCKQTFYASLTKNEEPKAFLEKQSIPESTNSVFIETIVETEYFFLHFAIEYFVFTFTNNFFFLYSVATVVSRALTWLVRRLCCVFFPHKIGFPQYLGTLKDILVTKQALTRNAFKNFYKVIR